MLSSRVSSNRFGRSPDRKATPADLASWPDAAGFWCDVPRCRTPALRHLPICRCHAEMIQHWMLDRCHAAVEDGQGVVFAAWERQVRDLAIKGAEAIGWLT